MDFFFCQRSQSNEGNLLNNEMKELLLTVKHGNGTGVAVQR